MISISNPGKVAKGKVVLVSSKSESNRILIIKTVSQLPLRIKNLSESKDTQTLEEILKAESMRTATAKTPIYNVGPAGTTMRFLTALFACRPGNYIITGSERMKKRPLSHLVNALRQLGADIRYLETEGYPPLEIRGKTLSGGEIAIDGSVSSQFTSALMMVAPLMQEGLILNFKNGLVSASYVEMTASIMKRFGVNVEIGERRVIVSPGQYAMVNEEDHEYVVEGDWSSASYMYAVAALAQEAEIELPSLKRNSPQPDSACFRIFEAFGVRSDFTDKGLTIKKISSPLPVSFSYDFSDCPDLAQTLAVVCAAKKIPAELKGLVTLRVKETNRIAALQKELEKFNVRTETEGNSVLKIFPERADFSKPVEVETYEDHRMAMSFSALAMICPEILIRDKDVIKKSYPGFWSDLKTLGYELQDS